MARPFVGAARAAGEQGHAAAARLRCHHEGPGIPRRGGKNPGRRRAHDRRGRAEAGRAHLCHAAAGDRADQEIPCSTRRAGAAPVGQPPPKMGNAARTWAAGRSQAADESPWVGAALAGRIGCARSRMVARARDRGQPMAVAFDEMKGTDGALRPAYGELSRWLGEVPPDVLDYRRREAELLFRRIGITFAVYGEADAQERLIPFDVIPRILAAAEWDILRAGLEQRVKAHQPLHQRHLRPARNPQGRHRARGSGLPEPGVPAGDERPEGAARHLRAHRRHRHRARRRRDLLRARRQCAHALRRLLHAGEPGDHAAAVSGAVRPPPRRAGRELSRRAAGDA